MLVLGSRLISTPIMGLQTGTRLAVVKAPVIDPSNLKIVAYEIEGPLLVERPSLIRTADIRELGSVGMIVDSSDEFIGVSDVIAVEKLYNLGFKLLGLAVVDEANHKLGKVEDYSVDTESFVIQQLNVKRGIIKSLAETSLLIHRSQIIEINDRNVVVRTTAKKLEPLPDSKLVYMNPFRSQSPQTDSSHSSAH